MGQKVNPKGLRIGIINTWNSKWFSKKEFIPRLRQDVVTRKFIMKKLREAGVSKVEIERHANKLVINVFVAKPGLVIGRSGSGVEDLKRELEKTILNKQATSVPGKLAVSINVLELENPNMHAQIILDYIVSEIEKRIPYRRAMKSAIQRVEKAGAKGVKITIAGRLNGSDIAREETLASGSLPLHTLRADIDYTRGAAATIFGQIGIKVWIYRGEVFAQRQAAAAAARRAEPVVGSVVKAKTK